MKEVHTLYKLIVLYLLDQVKFPLTNGQLCAFMAEEQYTDYFTLQQTLSDMLEIGLLKTESVRNTTFYLVTDSGKETLEYFTEEISPAIRQDIALYLKKNRFELREENSVLADYCNNEEGEFTVMLQAKEKETVLIDLKLRVPLEQQAIRLCDNWKKQSAKIYQYIMEELMRGYQEPDYPDAPQPDGLL